MIDINSLIEQYPMNQRQYKRHIIREYLQLLILSIIYKSNFSNKLIFMGGTAIRIFHNNNRFSEDLDFDNKGITIKEFDELAAIIKNDLSRQGFDVENKQVFKGAYHCYIRFKGLLFENNISGYKEEKILIQLDTEKQNYKYEPEKVVINKFGIFRYVSVVPVSLLLSQKIYASLKRKKLKGRDFFDIVYLFSLTKPDYNYLFEKIQISNLIELKDYFLKQTTNVDFEELAKDVRPFLINNDEADRILFFREFIAQLS